MKKKIIAAILVALVIGGVLFLTLQGPKETIALSEKVRNIAIKLGYKGTALQFRSDVHLIEYFIVGLVMILLSKTMGWKAWVGAVIAGILGLLDEVLKVFLPTREFGYIDLIKDFIGIGAVFVLIKLIERKKKKVYDEKSGH